MNISIKERGTEVDSLSFIAEKRFNLGSISPRFIINVLDRIISSGRVNELGQQFLVDCKELCWLRDPPNVLVASSLKEARDNVSLLLTEVPGRIGYITGGMEGLHLQILLNGLIATKMETIIIGLEEDSYIAAKGREPLYTTKEKVALWQWLAPDNSVLFVTPKKPDDISSNNYYDWIVQYLGLFRNDQIIYLGSSDDPQEIILAHQRRAASQAHCLNFSLGKPTFHTSNFLVSR